MVSAPKIINVAADGELARLLDEAATTSLVLEKDGVRYRLTREDEGRRAELDIQAAIAGIRAAAGSWKQVDAEAFKDYIAERRRASSRPAVKL